MAAWRGEGGRTESMMTGTIPLGAAGNFFSNISCMKEYLAMAWMPESKSARPAINTIDAVALLAAADASAPEYSKPSVVGVCQ